MKFKGKVWKFSDDVNTDEIIPASYLTTSDPQELAKHCMEGVDKAFPAKVKRGDIIVGGRNFGCGSSREHAPIAIKACGVVCVVAESFARIFFRNAINIGFPILECRGVESFVRSGDLLEVDFSSGTVKNLSNGKSLKGARFPEFMESIIESGGLMEWIRREVTE